LQPRGAHAAVRNSVTLGARQQAARRPSGPHSRIAGTLVRIKPRGVIRGTGARCIARRQCAPAVAQPQRAACLGRAGAGGPEQRCGGKSWNATRTPVTMLLEREGLRPVASSGRPPALLPNSCTLAHTLFLQLNVAFGRSELEPFTPILCRTVVMGARRGVDAADLEEATIRYWGGIAVPPHPQLCSSAPAIPA
jgi:hypothetical protein